LHCITLYFSFGNGGPLRPKHVVILKQNNFVVFEGTIAICFKFINTAGCRL